MKTAPKDPSFTDTSEHLGPSEEKVTATTADEKVLVERITPDVIIAAPRKSNLVSNIIKGGSVMGAAAAMVALVVFSLRKKK